MFTKSLVCVTTAFDRATPAGQAAVQAYAEYVSPRVTSLVPDQGIPSFE